MAEGVLKKIKIFLQKGQPPEIASNALCVVDLGLQGDRFAKGGAKQVTVIDQQCEQWLEKQQIKGLCFDKFKANLTIGDIDLSKVNSGEKLFIGDAVLTVSQEKKECFAECARVQNCMECMLRTNAKYLVVSSGGTININDNVTL